MPQRYYIDKEDLDNEFEKLDRMTYSLTEFAFYHEDMENTVYNLLSKWIKETSSLIYNMYLDEFNELTVQEQSEYEDYEDFLMCNYGNRWWYEGFFELDDDAKQEFLIRYRDTIYACLHSDTYNEEEIYNTIY